MNRTVLIFTGVGAVILGIVLFFLLYGSKGNHLELTGTVLKARTGAMDEGHSIAVLDFRISNPSKIRFEVREVKATLEKADGQKLEALLVSKSDVNQVFAYNKFLGKPYNDTLSIKDKVPPGSQIDRMVVAEFEIPGKELETAKSITLYIQDLDGAEFQTVYKLP